MYLRYTQPPGDLYDWYEDYLQDEEEIDVKAGGGQVSHCTIAFILLLSICRFFCPVLVTHYIFHLLEYNNRTDGLSISNKTGLVFNFIPAHPSAHTKANRKETRTVLPR